MDEGKTRRWRLASKWCPPILALFLSTVALAVSVAVATSPVVRETPAKLLVVGHLDQITKSPDCGGFHFGAVAVYSDVRVLEGAYAGPVLHVVHGCPELSRSQYRDDAGDLVAFKVGDYHRLWLTLGDEPGVVVVTTKGLPPLPRYYCRKVNLEQHVKRDTNGGTGRLTRP